MAIGVFIIRHIARFGTNLHIAERLNAKEPPFARTPRQCRMRSIRFDYKVMQCLAYTTAGSVNAGQGYPRAVRSCPAVGGELRRGYPYIRKAPLNDCNLLVRQTGPCLGDNS